MTRLLLVLGTLLAFTAAEAVWSLEDEAVFIVAKRDLKDPTFGKTVVLVIPDADGPVGVIINRPTRRKLRNMFSETENLQQSLDRVFFGGPIAYQMLAFLVRSPTPPKYALLAVDDLYLSKDRDYLEELFRRPEPTKGLRVYLGFSGWSTTQLEREIARGDWFVMKADPALVFSDNPERLWEELIEKASARSVLAPADVESAPIAVD